MFIGERVDTDLEHPLGGTLLSREQGCSTDARNGTDDSQEHDAKEMLCSVYTAFWKQQDSRDRKQASGRQGLGRGDWLPAGIRKHFRVTEMFHVVLCR